jgi:carbon-monoxide dehydrogenase medium subunit
VSPYPFHYHRAHSLAEASTLLSQLGEEAKLLAGGQSLIPLMKLRLARPSALVDLNFVPGLSAIEPQNGEIRFGAMVRHAAIEDSAVSVRVPILHDCAAGIADPQVRNMGTIGGSVAEADPSSDWIAVLLTLGGHVRCVGPQGERTVAIADFVKDAYTTVLAPTEIVREIVVKVPAARSGGAFVAFKRCAPVYASASAAVQLTLAEGDVCREARIALGCVGLTAIVPAAAEAALRGQAITAKSVDVAADAAMAAAEPQPDMRGSAEYKRILIRALVKRAIHIAARRARGERVEATHEYVGR